MILNIKKIILIIASVVFNIGLQAQDYNVIQISVNYYEVKDTSLYPVLDSIILILENCSSDASKKTTDYFMIYVVDTHYFSINYDSYLGLSKTNKYNGFMYNNNLFLINNYYQENTEGIDIVPMCLNPTGKIKTYYLKIVPSKIIECMNPLAVICKEDNCYIDPLIWTQNPELLKVFEKRKDGIISRLYQYLKK